MPGFGPAAEAILFRQKDPKPLTPRLARSDGNDADLGRADQLAALKQGPPENKSVRPEGRPAGVRQRQVGQLDRKALEIIDTEIKDLLDTL